MKKIILKAPFELGIVERERIGTAEAPDIIAEEIGDIQDVVWQTVDVRPNFDETMQNIEKSASVKDFVIGVGGDHSISFGFIKAFSKKFKERALVYFDAHLDCQDDWLPPSHEDILRAVVKQGFVKPENILVIGARTWTQRELDFVKEKKVKIGKLEDVSDFIKDKKNLYISIDIDVVDPAFAPGTGWPEKDGISENQLLEALKILSGSGKVRGLDVVEVCPRKDVKNKTIKLAAKALRVFLSES